MNKNFNKQHLFQKTAIFFNIKNVFPVNFEKCNSSSLNKCINFCIQFLYSSLNPNNYEK